MHPTDQCHHLALKKNQVFLISLYLEVWSLSLIDDKPHQNVELLVEWEGLPSTGKENRSYALLYYKTVYCIDSLLHNLKFMRLYQTAISKLTPVSVSPNY